MRATDEDPAWTRAAGAIVIASAAAFAALMTIAMAIYPGGTWADPGARGYDFFRNFFCDLLRDVALDGTPSHSPPFAVAAMLALVVGLFPFWLLVPRLCARGPRFTAAVRALGLVSAAAIVAVPLTPSSRCGALHAAAIYVAGVPGLAAAALATGALLASREARRPHGYLAAAVWVAAAADGVVYTRLVLSGEAVPPAVLPALQKVAGVLLLAWLVATGARFTGRRGSDPAAAGSPAPPGS